VCRDCTSEFEDLMAAILVLLIEGYKKVRGGVACNDVIVI